MSDFESVFETAQQLAITLRSETRGFRDYAAALTGFRELQEQVQTVLATDIPRDQRDTLLVIKDGAAAIERTIQQYLEAQPEHYLANRPGAFSGLPPTKLGH